MFGRGNFQGMSRENVRIPVQEYNSIRVAVMIFATLVNTQTHTRGQTAFGKLYHFSSATS